MISRAKAAYCSVQNMNMASALSKKEVLQFFNKPSLIIQALVHQSELSDFLKLFQNISKRWSQAFINCRRQIFEFYWSSNNENEACQERNFIKKTLLKKNWWLIREQNMEEFDQILQRSYPKATYAERAIQFSKHITSCRFEDHGNNLYPQVNFKKLCIKNKL